MPTSQCILLPAVYRDFGRCGSQVFAQWHYNVTELVIEPDCNHLSLMVVLCATGFDGYIKSI